MNAGLAGRLLAGVMFLGLLGGCASREQFEVAEVLSRDSCQAISPGVHRVSFDQLAAIRGSVLIGMTAPQAPEASDLVLLAISRGTQPTPGYGFKLANTYIDEAQGERVGVVELAWTTPPPDAVLAQVITHPCIVVGLAGSKLTGVRALVSGGELIGELAL